MAKFIPLLLVAAIAVAVAADTRIPSPDKLEAAARSGNWDEFSNLLTKNVARQLTANKLSVPLMQFVPPIPPLPIPAISALPIPPIPAIPIPSMLPMPPISSFKIPDFSKLTSFKGLKGSSSSKYSGTVITSSNSTTIDDNGNVYVYSNNNQLQVVNAE